METEQVEYVDHENEKVKGEEIPYFSDDVVITSENFHEYFFDVKNTKPKKGQVLARYSAMAELVKGDDKKMLIKMLMQPESALAAAKYMQKIFKATEQESFRVTKEIAEDMMKEINNSKTPWKKVLNKAYRFQIEAFFYTWPECVPQDPHWQCITLQNLDKFLEGVVQKAIENAENGVEPVENEVVES